MGKFDNLENRMARLDQRLDSCGIDAGGTGENARLTLHGTT